MLTRRRFLAAIAAASAGTLGYGRWVEPGRIDVTTHRVGALGAGNSPLRLLHLTDLHLQRIGRHEERVAETAHALRPHLIAITGDSVDRADRLGLLADFLGLLPRVPTFATLGNWEHWSGVDRGRLHDAYSRRGARLLLDESVEVRHQGGSLLLTGMDDATAGRPDLERALRDAAPAPNHAVLAHSPVYRDVVAAHPAGAGFTPSLVLSGHTHGGQVNLGGWAPARPAGSGRYVAGWYREPAPALYVSRGIGTSVLPLRLGAPPEVALFEWHLG